MKKLRAHKWIAMSGALSRRGAEEAIRNGRVSLNGEVFTDLGHLIDPLVDVLHLDGKRVEPPSVKRTFLFHKPKGVMTTKSDPEGRPTVMDYFQDVPGVNPVGRLDFDSEGLLLLTEDGDLLLKLTHPRYGVKKVYEVELTGKGKPGWEQEALQSVELSDGPGKFDSLEALKVGRSYRVAVSEGRNRFIRRMFAALGFTVVRLLRTRMGEHQLGDLQPGERQELHER